MRLQQSNCGSLESDSQLQSRGVGTFTLNEWDFLLKAQKPRAAFMSAEKMSPGAETPFLKLPVEVLLDEEITWSLPAEASGTTNGLTVETRCAPTDTVQWAPSRAATTNR